MPEINERAGVLTEQRIDSTWTKEMNGDPHIEN